MILVRFLVPAIFFLGIAAQADEPKPPPSKPKPVAGRSELLRHIPKKFAALLAVDSAKREVVLHVETEKEPTRWSVNPDAELKIHGWWARLDQFKVGERVWVWFDLDRKHQPKSILMLADEFSQQDIGGVPPVLESIDEKTKSLSLKTPKGEKRTVRLGPEVNIEQAGGGYRLTVPATGGGQALFAGTLKPGDKVFVQTANGVVREVADAAGLEKLREAQKLALRKRWQQEGLPGTVTILHPLSGELEIILDHEAIRWGRNLRNGDRVHIFAADKIAADVKETQPWRERTLVRLVLGGFDQADLKLGQRVQLLVSSPPPEVDTADMPPDIDRPRTKPERVEWFLASTYCTCNVPNNTCTGMFYTLASCNVNACGMPNHIRELVAEMIDKGMTDRQIWDELKKSQGPLMTKPHLLP